VRIGEVVETNGVLDGTREVLLTIWKYLRALEIRVICSVSKKFSLPPYNCLVQKPVQHSFWSGLITVDKLTIEFAAKHGNLNLIKWCRDNGYKWTEKTAEYAAQYQDYKAFLWCMQKGCPFDKEECPHVAGSAYKFDTYKYLYSLGFSYRHIHSCAIEIDDLEMLNWCFEHQPGQDHKTLSKDRV
jgi:hypothetical protein